MIYRFRDRWYQAAHDPSLRTGDFDTFQVQKTQYESKSKMQREWERQVKVGMPQQTHVKLGWVHDGMIFQWSIPDIWWVERCFHLIWYHEKTQSHSESVNMKQMKISKVDESPSEWSTFCLHLSSFPGTQGGFGASVDGHPVGGAKIFGMVWVASWILQVMLKSWVLPRPPMIPQAMARCFDGWWNCRCLVGATLVICQAILEVALVDTSW